MPVARREWLGLAGLLIVAAAVRFLDLPTRGTWDADQGHDMLVLRSFVRDGIVPLVGPPTSVGGLHHGALYYWLLAPVAAVSGADPLAIVAAIAAAGIAAVAVVWWLARAMAGPDRGPLAGLVAGGLMAVSATAIEESTFIWNPNLIALASATALAAAWQAWTTGDARWWLVAAAAQAVTMHCHVLGAVQVVPLAGLLVVDAGRRETADGRRRVLLAGLAGAALIAASYAPLLVSELRGGFPEIRALIAFVGTDSGRDAAALPVRVAIVWLRVLSWPLAGLVTERPTLAILVAGLVIGLFAWRLRAARGPERTAVRWLAATLAWGATTMAVISPSLAQVVPGLPNDHYHAFLDPVVFVVVGLGAAAAWRLRPRIARAAVVVAVAALIALNVAIWPARVAPDGGYPGAERAAARIIAALAGRPYVLLGEPAIKPTDAYGFPLVRLGLPPAEGPAAAKGSVLVIACDRLLEAFSGPCGGVAEGRRVASLGGDWTLESRFDASARTVVSIYAPTATGRS